MKIDDHKSVINVRALCAIRKRSEGHCKIKIGMRVLKLIGEIFKKKTNKTKSARKFPLKTSLLLPFSSSYPLLPQKNPLPPLDNTNNRKKCQFK